MKPEIERRREYPGAQYIDSTVDGLTIAVYHGKVVTSWAGDVIFPIGDGLLRQAAMNDLGEFAGIGSDDNVWEWKNGKWNNEGKAFGPEAVGYDNNNKLEVIRNWPARGIRYFTEDNRIVTCTETNADPGIELWEFTTRGDLQVGHGSAAPHGPHHGDPIIVRRHGVNLQLEAGDGKFVRFRRRGRERTMSWRNNATNMCVAVWPTLEEIDALKPVPRVSTPVKPPVDPVKPPPVKEPEVEIPNLFRVVKAVSDAHPHLIATNTRETIKELYWRVTVALHQADPKFGMLTKTPPENGQEIGGHFVAMDAVAYKGAEPVVDIFGSAGDGPGTGSIGWGEDEHRRESNKWLAPPQFVGGPVVVVPPPPVGDTHPYEGGDNDTGKCDTIINGKACNEPREAAVHQAKPMEPVEPTEPEPEPVDPPVTEAPEALTILREILARVVALEQDVLALAERPVPTVPKKFKGQVTNRFIGTTSVELVPVQE